MCIFLPSFFGLSDASFTPPESVCCSCLMTQHCHWHRWWKCVSDWSDKYRDNISEPWKRATLWGLSPFLIRHTTPIFFVYKFWSGISIWIIHLNCVFLSVAKFTIFYQCQKSRCSIWAEMDAVPSGSKRNDDILSLPKMMRFHQCQRVHSVLKTVTLVPRNIQFSSIKQTLRVWDDIEAVLFSNVSGFHKQQIQTAGSNDSSDWSYQACVFIFLQFTTQTFSSCLQLIFPFTYRLKQWRKQG